MEGEGKGRKFCGGKYDNVGLLLGGFVLRAGLRHAGELKEVLIWERRGKKSKSAGGGGRR